MVGQVNLLKSTDQVGQLDTVFYIRLQVDPVYMVFDSLKWYKQAVADVLVTFALTDQLNDFLFTARNTKFTGKFQHRLVEINDYNRFNIVFININI